MSLIELLRAEITALEEKLAKNAPHGCRFCLWFDCSKNDKCKCGCGSVGKERALHIERLRYLVECAESGEVPTSGQQAEE